MVSAALYNWVSAGLERTDRVLQRNNTCKQRDVQDQTISTVAGRKVTQVPSTYPWLALKNMLSTKTRTLYQVLQHLMVLSPNIFIIWETMVFLLKGLTKSFLSFPGAGVFLWH